MIADRTDDTHPHADSAVTPRARPGELALRAPITPGQHAVLDYAVAGTFLIAAMSQWHRHRPAARLALLNGGMVAGLAMLTDYPGGVFRTLSFQGHRTGDLVQAALAGLGPVLFGFAGDKEATFFYGQAASEVGVIAATDWDAA
jgi:hypothetical protein